MGPAEEQAEELEALEAIFMDDYQLEEQATSDRGARFRVSIRDESAENIKFQLAFTHPLNYPEEPIIVVLYAIEGLSASRRKALQQVLNECAEENISIPSAFVVCEAAREWIAENVVGNTDQDDEEDNSAKFETIDSSSRKTVEVIASKMIGTPVTLETFTAWKEKFLAEMELQADKASDDPKLEKPTGREMFERKMSVVLGDSEMFWEAEADNFDIQ